MDGTLDLLGSSYVLQRKKKAMKFPFYTITSCRYTVQWFLSCAAIITIQFENISIMRKGPFCPFADSYLTKVQHNWQYTEDNEKD